MALDNGFRRRQFNEIKKEIEQSLIASLGSVNLIAPSIFASIVSIFAEREASLWEGLEAIYNSSFPNTAEGYSLDGICALTGVIREVDTYSQGVCSLTAINHTKIPKYSQIRVKHTSNLFALAEDVIVSNEKCSGIKLQVRESLRSNYEISINDQVFKYSKDQQDTPDSIAQTLAKIINDSNSIISATSENELCILSSKNHLEEFSCFISEGLKIADCTSNALVLATEKGAIIAPAGSLVGIHTPVSGWISCINLGAAKIGNKLEADISLRARREASIKLGGSGSFEAIRANLLNLPGVTSVTITENTSSQVSREGLPPHSFRALVTGGENSEIARVLWQKKPAGISTYGTLQVSTTDSSENPQVVNFSRPLKCHTYVKVVITKTASFNESCLPAMREKLTQQINSLGTGSNVILKSLFLSIFTQQGITNAAIYLGGTTRESYMPKLKEADIKIKQGEVAFTDPSRIEIILEDF